MSNPSVEALQHLMELLLVEKKEDYEQHKAKIEALTLSERREKGFTWHPVEVVKTGFTVGDRAFVTVEIAKDNLKNHRFRSGQPINFYTLQPEAYKKEYSGVINFVDKNKMKIVLNSEDHPDWLNQGMIGVDMMFDERSYREMEAALKKVMAAKGDRLAELRAIIHGKKVAEFSPLEKYIDLPNLNASQNSAIKSILSSKDLAIVHGPPGTGKTTTLTYAIKLLSQQESTILVCAPSNAAVDLLTERLANQQLKVVRIGNISRLDEAVIEHTLDAQLSNHPDSKNIKKVKIQAAESRKLARKYKRNFGSKQKADRQALYKEARDLMDWANQMEDRLVSLILNGADVICCTLVGSNNRILEKLQFKTVIIDEAAQALEPATWIPIAKAEKVVLTGDPFQLPPTVKSKEAQRRGFNITMIEKCLEHLPEVNLLNTQYRMHQNIMGFSNSQFYNNQLIAADSVKERCLEDQEPLVYIDTAGCGFEEKVNPEYLSKFNPDEYNILREHIYQLIDSYAPEHCPEIAIISPYREQVVYIKKDIEVDEKLKGLPISVNTIDAFQGQERAVVYISLVRSNAKSEIGFLGDYRRMNVAMTRAMKKLVVIGDSATIGSHQFFGDFIDYVEKVGVYKSAWEYMAS